MLYKVVHGIIAKADKYQNMRIMMITSKKNSLICFIACTIQDFSAGQLKAPTLYSFLRG